TAGGYRARRHRDRAFCVSLPLWFSIAPEPPFPCVREVPERRGYRACQSAIPGRAPGPPGGLYLRFSDCQSPSRFRSRAAAIHRSAVRRLRSYLSAIAARGDVPPATAARYSLTISRRNSSVISGSVGARPGETLPRSLTLIRSIPPAVFRAFSFPRLT